MWVYLNNLGVATTTITTDTPIRQNSVGVVKLNVYYNGKDLATFSSVKVQFKYSDNTYSPAMTMVKGITKHFPSATDFTGNTGNFVSDTNYLCSTLPFDTVGLLGVAGTTKATITYYNNGVIDTTQTIEFYITPVVSSEDTSISTTEYQQLLLDLGGKWTRVYDTQANILALASFDTYTLYCAYDTNKLYFYNGTAIVEFIPANAINALNDSDGNPINTTYIKHGTESTGSVAVGADSVATIHDTFTSDTLAKNRTLELYSPEYIFFRNANVDTAKTTRGAYTNGKSLADYLESAEDIFVLLAHMESLNGVGTLVFDSTYTQIANAITNKETMVAKITDNRLAVIHVYPLTISNHNTTNDFLSCGAVYYDRTNPDLYIDTVNITIDNSTQTLSGEWEQITQPLVSSDSATTFTIGAISYAVPTKTSGLTNDSGFITNAVNNLVNYYLKADTYTKTEVNNLIGAISTLHFEVVATLPTTGSANIIYLLPDTQSTTNNYEEWIYVNNAWELIGTTSVDLTNYLSSTAVIAQNHIVVGVDGTRKVIDSGVVISDLPTISELNNKVGAINKIDFTATRSGTTLTCNSTQWNSTDLVVGNEYELDISYAIAGAIVDTDTIVLHFKDNVSLNIISPINTSGTCVVGDLKQVQFPYSTTTGYRYIFKALALKNTSNVLFMGIVPSVNTQDIVSISSEDLLDIVSGITPWTYNNNGQLFLVNDSGTNGYVLGHIYKLTYDYTNNAILHSDITTTYTLPTASASVLGGIKIGQGLGIIDGVASVGASESVSSTSVSLTAGIMNINTPSANTTYALDSTTTGLLNLFNGSITPSVNITATFPSGITWQYDSDITYASNVFTLIASHHYEFSIQNNYGIMVDYSSVGGDYTLPIASDSVLGGIKVGSNLTIDSTTGVLSAVDTTYSVATSSTNGLMSNTDKTKLDLYPATYSTITDLIDAKQNTLVSGSTIKTINGVSVLGSGDIPISGGTTNFVIQGTVASGTITFASGTTANDILTAINNNQTIIFEDTANTLPDIILAIDNYDSASSQYSLGGSYLINGATTNINYQCYISITSGVLAGTYTSKTIPQVLTAGQGIAITNNVVSSGKSESVASASITLTAGTFNINAPTANATYALGSSTTGLLNNYSGSITPTTAITATFPSGIKWSYDTAITYASNVFTLVSGHTYEFSIQNNCGVFVDFGA